MMTAVPTSAAAVLAPTTITATTSNSSTNTASAFITTLRSPAGTDPVVFVCLSVSGSVESPLRLFGPRRPVSL